MAFFDFDEDELEAELQELESDSDGLKGCDKLVKRRESAAGTWYSFWSSVKSVAEPDQIWYDLCETGEKQRHAVQLCQKFLEKYVTSRKRHRVSLGPSEKKAEGTVYSAASLVKLWRHLIIYFNQTVLARRRREDPARAARWTLGFKGGYYSHKGSGPIYEVIGWIGNNATRLGLSLGQLFVKKGATAEDIALILRTLWERAEDIPCAPLTRLSFHAMLMLGGIGGFRPGVVENIKYRQVEIELVRDPTTGEKRPVAKFTLQQNKQEEGKIKRDQRDVISFYVTLVPYSIFCLAGLAIAQDLSDNAFDPPFGSAREMLERPLMEEHINTVSLPWKEDFLDKEIFPISYHQYWGLWKRTLLVAGFPESLRPYAVRVGAGNRLDGTSAPSGSLLIFATCTSVSDTPREGVLTPALRNYIFSHSSKIFERSYQARLVNADLLSSLAPEAKAENSEELFRILRNSSLRCDQLAPVDVPSEEIDHWKDTRDDMRALLSSNDYRKSTRVRILTKKLTDARLKDIRERYFKESNRRRALGQSTDDLRAAGPKLRRNRGAEFPAEVIGEHFKQNSDDCPDRQHELMYIEVQVSFLEQKLQSEPTCLLCTGANSLEASGSTGEGNFKSWADVWKHTNKAHRSKELWPFSCPECDRLGNEESLDQIANLGEWCSHVHEHHAPIGLAPYRCILGCQTFDNMTALREHLANCHRALWTVAKPFPCPECQRLGSEDCIISDAAEWRRHIDLHHDPRLLPPMTKASSATSKAHSCLLCADWSYTTKVALSLHNTNIHVKGGDFTSPFACPECRRLNKVDRVISGVGEWCKHVAAHHGIEHAPNPPLPMDERPCCLLCNTPTYNPRKHFQTMHVKTGQFDKPFPCPECARRGAKVPYLVQDRNDWHIHCVASHGQEAPVGLQNVAGKRPRSRCLVCGGHFQGMSKHFTTKHVDKGLFSQPFACPECLRKGTDCSTPSLIHSRAEWVTHCAAAHRDVSSVPLAHSMCIARKQTEMDRLVLDDEGDVSDHSSGPEDKSQVSHGRPRSNKRQQEVEEYEKRATKRRG